MKQQKILKKELNKKIKQYKSKLKQYFNICSWVEFESVEDNAIKINNSKYLLGLKIIPPKLSGADELEKLEWIDRYNRVLNSTPLEIYHYTILSPINVDAEINSLTNQIKNEDDYEIIKLLQNEINNYETLSIHNQKSEFFEMFVGNINNKRFIKECDDLKRTFLREGFEVEMLNCIDYMNYLAYIFENDMINNFYMSRGLFDLDEAAERKKIDELEVYKPENTSNA